MKMSLIKMFLHAYVIIIWHVHLVLFVVHAQREKNSAQKKETEL